jgi:hypothetical protein
VAELRSHYWTHFICVVVVDFLIGGGSSKGTIFAEIGQIDFVSGGGSIDFERRCTACLREMMEWIRRNMRILD